MFKDFFKDFFKNAKTFYLFMIRNIFWILLIAIPIYLIGATTELGAFVWTIVLIEGLALGLSEFAQFVYTRLNFKTENQAVLGHIFLGVHLLIGLVTLGIYFIKFSAPTG